MRAPTRLPTVADLVACAARADGDRMALAVGADGRRLTRAELGARAAAWTAALGGSEAPWRRRVGLVAGDPLAFASTYLSLLAAGVAVAPLNPDAAPAECHRQAELLGADLVLTDRPDLGQGPCPTWQLQDGVPRSIAARPRPALADDAPPAVLLASSGTTGTPKIVPLAERQLLSVAGPIARHHPLGPGELGYSPLP